MAQNTKDGAPNAGHRFGDMRIRHITEIESLLAAGEYVDGAKLAEVLRKHGTRPLPERVLDYLCQYLDGDIKKPKGFVPGARIVRSQFAMILAVEYHRRLEWLKNRRKRYGHLRGWAALHGADFWEGPPHEIAARMVARRWHYGVHSWRTVLNVVSSRR